MAVRGNIAGNRADSDGEYAMQQTLLTVQDVIEATRLSRTVVYELLKHGELPALRVGRAIRVRNEDMQSWIEKQRADTAANISGAHAGPGIASEA
ncbi:MAG TPA: helix-turn-helix domain-containing protein [Candidatus Limnocylindrales bacterium]|nr:helix-turn-helix domain-containing protein [Candidatus Limnocylindrales bacterium]